jgi:hypothetical protein
MWGARDSDLAWCAGCSEIGREWLERKRLPGFPRVVTGWARICRRCWVAGWRLTEPKELGVFWWTR